MQKLNQIPLTFSAHNNPVLSTYAFDMADDGTVVGYFYDASFNATGYLRKPDGTYVDIVYPAAPTRTFAQRMNNAGTVIGNATIAGWNQGWAYDTATATFTAVQVPGAKATFAQDIAEDGTIIGYATFYPDATRPTYFLQRGYTLANGQYTLFDAPGALYTYARAIDGAGRIGGSYVVAGTANTNVTHTFVREPDGSFVTNDAYSDLGNLVLTFGMNTYGDRVGTCAASNGSVWGCWQSGGSGTVTRYALYAGHDGTNPWQVKDNGTVIGWVYAKTGKYMGFVSPHFTR